MATTTNYGWDTPDDTDLVKDGAAAIRTLGSSIDTTTKNLNPETTLGDLAYRSATANVKTRLALGTAGQVLRVNSGGNAPEWATTADQTPLTTKGDLFTFSTVDARLGVGANGTVLTADSAEATGLKWATAGGGGKVLQVVQAVDTGYIAITSIDTFEDANLSASITPSSASSKVLVIISQQINFYTTSSAGTGAFARLRRATTTIWNGSATAEWVGNTSATGGGPRQNVSIVYLDSPATTSSTTYKPQYKQTTNTNDRTIYMQNGNGGASTITLMEIGA